jgi:16S rRNA (adenine1518-N6/adenine1519-N6)-dimethyltransferase
VLPHVERLHAVEIDRDLAARLRHISQADKLVVYEADALAFDFAQLPKPLRIIGNLPYNISSPLLFHLAEHLDHVQDQHFMLQKEVVDRLAATPGSKDFGRLTVMLGACYDIEWLFDVPPEAFEPPPRVMSAIVRMTPIPAARRTLLYPAVFRRLVAGAFSQRRKMLRNTLAELVSESQAHAVGIDLTWRAENVSTAQYIALANSLGGSSNNHREGSNA